MRGLIEFDAMIRDGLINRWLRIFAWETRARFFIFFVAFVASLPVAILRLLYWFFLDRYLAFAKISLTARKLDAVRIIGRGIIHRLEQFIFHLNGLGIVAQVE